METRNFRITEHQIPGSFIRQHRRATINKNDTVRLAVKEYRNENSPSGGHNEISIIGAHANGFPKELYEPLWDELAVSLAANGLHVSVVLIADISFQGQSGVLNSNILGNDRMFHFTIPKIFSQLTVLMQHLGWTIHATCFSWSITSETHWKDLLSLSATAWAPITLLTYQFYILSFFQQ